MLTEQAMRQSNGPNVYMLVVSFAAALLGSADVRAEQPVTTQQHWSAEKILPPENLAGLQSEIICVCVGTQNLERRFTGNPREVPRLRNSTAELGTQLRGHGLPALYL